MTVKRDANQVGVKLFQLVVGAVKGERGSPVFKDAASGAVFGRVVGRRDALLEQEARDQRNVEGGLAGIFARDGRARRGVIGSRYDRTLRATEVTRVVVQNAR